MFCFQTEGVLWMNDCISIRDLMNSIDWSRLRKSRSDIDVIKISKNLGLNIRSRKDIDKAQNEFNLSYSRYEIFRGEIDDIVSAYVIKKNDGNIPVMYIEECFDGLLFISSLHDALVEEVISFLSNIVIKNRINGYDSLSLKRTVIRKENICY